MIESHIAIPESIMAGPAIFRRLWDTNLMKPDDVSALASLPWTRQHVAAHDTIHPKDDLCMLSSGMIFRQRSLENGDRCLMSLVVPGDICCYATITGSKPPSAMIAVTTCTVMRAPMEEVLEVCERHPNVLAAILSNLSVDNAVTEELLLSVGHRTALERMAHFLCELEFRFRRMRLSDNAQYLLSMTQADIGDYLALSAVHVNRTMQELRRRGLVRSVGARVNLLDRKELQRIANFSPAYLTDARSTSALRSA